MPSAKPVSSTPSAHLLMSLGLGGASNDGYSLFRAIAGRIHTLNPVSTNSINAVIPFSESCQAGSTGRGLISSHVRCKTNRRMNACRITKREDILPMER